MSMLPTPIEVFYCYADDDLPLLEQLERHLSTLRQEEFISTWHRHKINGGSDWRVESYRHLNTASLILLLISPDFLASDYLYREELPRALKRHKDNKARVIPILLRSCNCEDAPFEKLQMLPRNGTPLNSGNDIDAGFTEIVKEIRLILKELSSTLASKRPLWNAPYEINPFFTGRDKLLEQLHSEFTVHPRQVLSGIVGIGKTQVAIKYAHKYSNEYEFVLWADAKTPETLIASYNQIAELRGLAMYDAQEQDSLIEAVKRYLQERTKWLLILDDVKGDLYHAPKQHYLAAFLPKGSYGHILVTTQAHSLSHLGRGFGHSLLVEGFFPQEGIRFLLYRAGRLHESDDSAAQVSTDEFTHAQNICQAMQWHPLALDQAGAYIENCQCGLDEYFQLYEERRIEMLKKRGNDCEHSESVVTALSLSLDPIKENCSAALDLLHLCAFLAPEKIPEKILTAGAPLLGPELAAAADKLELNEIVQSLGTRSLIYRDTTNHTFSIHSLVQAVLSGMMEEQQRQKWQRRAVLLVEATYPEDTESMEQWAICEQWFPHALMCTRWFRDEQVDFPQAAGLLFKIGHYWYKHGRYTEARGWYQRSLKIRTRPLGPDSVDAAKSLLGLSNTNSELGEYDQAMIECNKCKGILERELGDMHPDITNCLNNLAILFKQARGDLPKEAEELYIRSLTIPIQSFITSGAASGKPSEAKEKQSTPKDQDIATLSKVLSKPKEEINRYIRYLLTEKTEGRKFAQILNNLAVFYAEHLHKYKTAEGLFSLSLWLQEQYLEHDAPEDEHDPKLYDTGYGLSLNNLANLYTVWGSNPETLSDKRQDPYEQAVLFYLESEGILKIRYTGVDHPDIAYPLHGQGILRFKQLKYDEAKEQYEKSLDIWKKHLGPDHSQTAYPLYNLANLYFEQGEYKEAKIWYKKSLDIWEKRLGPRHPHTLTCGKIYTLLSRNPKGETGVQKAKLVVLPTYRSFRL